jgi:hypothetical protein
MKIGSIVQWSSQAGGCWKEKQGKIVAVVPTNTNPIRGGISAQFNETHRSTIDSRSLGRPGESYLVEVLALGKGKPALYWPLASKLTEVAEGG